MVDPTKGFADITAYLSGSIINEAMVKRMKSN
jgi:hypothetical protein